MGCIIHIGMHKTGSTSIQISLQGFSDDRFLYADLGDGPNHSLAMYSLFAESPERHHLHKANGRDRSAVQDYVAKVRIDLEQAISTAHGRTLLISGEDISALQKNDLDKLHRYFREHFDDLMICGYVRPPAGYISSEFQEGVKGGVIDRVSPHQRYRHYEKTFRKFDEIFGRENVHLWKFEPKSFPGGCAVQDFCARLDISFPVERVIRANESLSRQAVSLLYTYRRFSKKRGFRGMAGQESQRVMERLGDIQHDKFRLSPAIVRPVLEANRADIQWMEERLGQSLDEELGAYRPGDVRNEADLLKPDPEVVKKLLALLGDAAPAGIKGETPEEVAVLVHALRENRGNQAGPLIEPIRKMSPKLLEDTPGDKAEALINPASQEYLETSRITQSLGQLDVVDERFCSGWAFYPKQPARAANVNVFVNDQLIHTVTAQLPRFDVKGKGIHPTGLCGFRFEWPAGTKLKVGDQVAARLEGDNKALRGSPKHVGADSGKLVRHRGATISEHVKVSPVKINAGVDARRINAVNVVAIYGQPSRGKSSLSHALSKADGFLWLKTDPIFSFQVAPRLANREDFMAYGGQPAGRHFNICRYVNSDCYDHNLFLACLKKELHRRLQESQTAHTVLLDGYVFKQYSRFFSDLGLPPERTLAMQAAVVGDRYMVEGLDVTGHRYDEVIEHIRQSFRTKCLKTTVPKSSYQSFNSMGLSQINDRNADSDTLAKYAASHLDDVVQASDRFVDIGCNAGYFCFRLADKTSGPIIGVDRARSWLEVASHMNNSIFLRDNIAFFNAEALEFLSENPDSFEIIHCASTYHYFRERQVDFLREAHRALTNNGMLVLEAELADTGTEPETTTQSRGIDSTPCAFPNRAMFLEQISGLFQIEAEFKSVFQEGSYYGRVYFHLRRLSPLVAPHGKG